MDRIGKMTAFAKVVETGSFVGVARQRRRRTENSAMPPGAARLVPPASFGGDPRVDHWPGGERCGGHVAASSRLAVSLAIGSPDQRRRCRGVQPEACFIIAPLLRRPDSSGIRPRPVAGSSIRRGG